MAKETLASLRKLAKGTGIKITKIKGTDNVVISGMGFDPIYKQLNGDVLGATTVVKARKKVIAKRKRG